MDHTQAHKIISALADGCDPTTGKEVEASILQRGDVIRALHIAVHALEVSVGLNDGRRRRLPANAGKPWTAQEDRELLKKFDSGASVARLARAHDRTTDGIQARLERHGRLQRAARSRAATAATAAIGVTRRKRSKK